MLQIPPEGCAVLQRGYTLPGARFAPGRKQKTLLRRAAHPLEAFQPSGGSKIYRHGGILGVVELPRVRFFIFVRVLSVLRG